MKRKISRRPFRNAPNASEALAMDRRLFASGGRPGAFGFFQVPQPLQHDPETVADGVAVLCLSGPIEHHSSWLWHSYEDLAAQIEAALADEQVNALVLKIDSPGGVAAGMGEAYRQIRKLRAQYKKPIFAYADEMACSAAYHVASAADEIWLPESAQVGSVGVILCTVDETKALDKAGLRVRYVVTGARKADMHPGQPVTDEVLEVAQAKVDYLGGLFFRAVAKARRMSPKAVQRLEAAVFCGEQAVAAGLADEVGSWPEFLDFVKKSTRATTEPDRATAQDGAAAHSSPPRKAQTMRKKKTILQLTKAAADAKTAVQKAVKALAAAATSGKAKATKELERATLAQIEAEAALRAAKMTKEKYEKVVEEEDDEPPPSSKRDEEEEEDDDEEEEERSESEEEEEKAIAKAFRSPRASAAGLYTPDRLLHLARAATGQKDIKAVFGALEGMRDRLKAVAKTERDVARLKRESRASKVDRMIDKAKTDGRIVGKVHADDMRAQGMQNGTKWLKGRLAAMPKLARTTIDGELVPRAGTEGEPIGIPDADAQKMFAAATAGMTPEQAAQFKTTVLANLNQKKKAGTPSH